MQAGKAFAWLETSVKKRLPFGPCAEATFICVARPGGAMRPAMLALAGQALNAGRPGSAPPAFGLCVFRQPG